MNGPNFREVDRDGFLVPGSFADAAAPPRSLWSRAKESSDRAPSAAPAWRLVWWRRVLVCLALSLVFGTLGKLFWDSQGPVTIARWFMHRAALRAQDDDLPGALVDLDRAVSWAPDNAEVFWSRGRIKLQLHDLEGSLADFDVVLRHAPRVAEVYSQRSLVLQRLERHEEAIADLTRGLECVGGPGEYIDLLNTRAYARAIAGVELDEALVDIEQALRLSGEPPAAYLDTRGYIHYLLGNDELALVDLDAAVAGAERERRSLRQWLRRGRFDSREAARRMTEFDQSLGVILHHRGEVHERLGHAWQAAEDLRRGDELGYDPSAGVY